MKYVDEFRDSKAAAVLSFEISRIASELESQKERICIMEVCGSHTMAIARYGIRSILPSLVDLVSGPGCPVCVTDSGYIDAAIELASRGISITTFGDMLRVPGTSSSLARARADGASVNVCYSPTDSVDFAAKDPGREYVFLAIGFETTIAPCISIIERARKRGVRNISLLVAFKLVPPALETLAQDPELKLDGFLGPAHVSAIIGSKAYEPVVSTFKIPLVVAGFEPLDILLGIRGILEQIRHGEAFVDNEYSRVVKPEGNLKAQGLMAKYLKEADVAWRGIGVIPQSGLVLQDEFSEYNAELKHGIEVKTGKVDSKCRCGDVLKGLIKPPDCLLFAKTCTPQNPIGACMVSTEGTCAAYYRYSR